MAGKLAPMTGPRPRIATFPVVVAPSVLENQPAAKTKARPFVNELELSEQNASMMTLKPSDKAFSAAAGTTLDAHHKNRQVSTLSVGTLSTGFGESDIEEDDTLSEGSYCRRWFNSSDSFDGWPMMVSLSGASDLPPAGSATIHGASPCKAGPWVYPEQASSVCSRSMPLEPVTAPVTPLRKAFRSEGVPSAPAPLREAFRSEGATPLPRIEVSLEAALMQGAEDVPAPPQPAATQPQQTVPVLPPPGLAESLGFASRGAVLHAAGLCKPCGWFWKPQGCQNGAECGHCHLCPRGENRMRKKAKRSAVQAEMAKVREADVQTPSGITSSNFASEESAEDMALTPASSRSPAVERMMSPSAASTSTPLNRDQFRSSSLYWEGLGRRNGQEEAMTFEL